MKFIKENPRKIIGLLIGIILLVVGIVATSGSASAATPVKHGEITVTPLGINSKNLPRFRVVKTKKAPKKIEVGVFRYGIDFTEDELGEQTKSSQIHKGGLIPDGLSQETTVVVWDLTDPNKPEQLYFEDWTTRNWKSLSKSCNKTSPTIVVSSSYAPKSAHLRVYKKNAAGKTVGKTISMIRAGRDGNDAFYTPDPKDMEGGWKAGKMVTKTEGFESATCLSK
jgi:hypothetical protein